MSGWWVPGMDVLGSMTKAELRELARRRNVYLGDARTKAEMAVQIHEVLAARKQAGMTIDGTGPAARPTYNNGIGSCGNPSRASYMAGCRCMRCRAANADYSAALAANLDPRKRSSRPLATERQTRKARERVQGWVDEGVPKRRVCEELGIPRSAMRALLIGHPRTGKPVKRMDLENYKRIMAHAGDFHTPDGAYIDSTNYWKAIDWLVAHGITRYRIAKEAGIPVPSLYAERNGRVTMGNARKLARAAARLKAEALEEEARHD